MKERTKKERIGFFGGTFDPPHLGHIHLCIALLEAAKLDQILVCPSGNPPVKDPASVLASKQDRYEMTNLAFQGIPGITVIDEEMHQETPCYTIDTIERLKKRLPGCELYLLLASDTAKSFFTWKEAKRLATLVHPLIGRRFMDAEIKELDPYFDNALIPIPLIDIRSTDIRERLHNKKFCGHLVPAKVLDYIYSHHLYF